MLRIHCWLAVLLLLGLAARAQSAKPVVRPGTLPQFSFNTLAGKAFTQQDLKPQLASLVIFFDPDCEHCQAQAQWLAAQPQLFTATQLLWVSTAELAAIAAFEQKYFAGTKLLNYFVKDDRYKFDAYFGYSTVPSIYVYDKVGKLRQEFHNEVAATVLAAALH